MPKHQHTLAALCVAGVMLGGALPARAEPRPLPASVVWTRGDLFYVAAADSGVLGAGMTLRVLHGRREVATGWISRLLDLRIAVAQLDSGSLAGEKRLDKLHLLGEDAAVARAPTLRVGLPGGGRTNLLFACRAPSLAHRLGVTSYRVDSLAVERYRMVRDSADASKAPDTLLVRLYADAADQEIALERGELDVAVFWPGELSARMRGDARWRDAPKGLRARGVLVCTATAGDSAGIPTAQLDALNRDAFGGDLLPWREFEPARAFAAVPAHVVPDPALPGARMLERLLARSVANSSAASVRLRYLDVPLVEHDSVHATWRVAGVTPVFAVRCPVLPAPAARASVSLLGADAFANLMLCAASAP